MKSVHIKNTEKRSSERIVVKISKGKRKGGGEEQTAMSGD